MGKAFNPQFYTGSPSSPTTLRLRRRQARLRDKSRRAHLSTSQIYRSDASKEFMVIESMVNY